MPPTPKETPKTSAVEEAEQEFSFSELVPTNARSLFPHLKTLDGRTISIINVAADDDSKKTFHVTLKDDSKYAVPPTLAKKVAAALQAAKQKGTKSVKATVKGLDRGVKLT